MPGRYRSAAGRPWWRRALDYSIKHRLAMLLVVEAFAIFGLAPLVDLGAVSHPLLGLTFTLILVSGMLGTDYHRLTGRMMIMFGILMLPVQLWRYLIPGAAVLVIHPLGLIGFLLLLTWALAVSLFRSQRIKLDQVLGGVIMYLNIGLTFAIAYSLVEHLSPGSFRLPLPGPDRPIHPTYFIYFSFVTLTTVGYGDTIPLSSVARSLSTLEAALGQLYPAIILARLVSIEVSQRDNAKARSEHRQQAAQNHGRAAGDLVHEGRKIEP